MLKKCCLCFLILAFASCGPNDVKPTPIAGAILTPDNVRTSLARGINLSNWFNDYSNPAQFGSRFTAEDMNRIHDAGFTYIRLPIAATLLFQESNPSSLQPGNLMFINQAIQMAIDANLAIIIDPIHNADETFEKRLAVDGDFQNKVITFWKAIATYFSKYPTNRVFFEIMNEPHVGAVGKIGVGKSWWWPLQERLIKGIREVSLNHWLIAGAESWNGRDDLVQQTPYNADYIVYNFHFYDPFLFTHQGAPWTGWQPAMDAHNVFYPSSPEAVDSLIQKATYQELKDVLNWYGNERFSVSSISGWIEPVTSWATTHNVVLMCNEFGSYKPVAPREARLNWLHDTRTVLEDKGIIWAVWEYDEGFGLINYNGPDRTLPAVDTEMLTALGL